MMRKVHEKKKQKKNKITAWWHAIYSIIEKLWVQFVVNQTRSALLTASTPGREAWQLASEIVSSRAD